MISINNLQDKCRGSLAGGAAGDALGYEVEFSSLAGILKRFGEKGITGFVTDSDGVALFSDDTQMSLFTAEGLLTAIAAGKVSEKDIVRCITDSYKHWYFTQSRTPSTEYDSWLMHVRPLWDRRAPGMTCLSALQSITASGNRRVVNNSKGCGGVMRVAPVGIFSAAHPDILDIAQAGEIAGAAADITHKHPLSTYSSMVLAMIVRECILCDRISRKDFRSIIEDNVFKILDQKYSNDKYLDKLRSLISQALSLAESDITDFEAISKLGEGWVAEETLAIAIFSVMRYIDDFEKCIVCSVNHDGDSDSTGAVAGNIIGAVLGYAAIPEKFLSTLELHDVIVSIADDLAGMSDERLIMERYVNRQPLNVDSACLIK